MNNNNAETINYSSYSYAELQQCLSGVDKTTYPHRYREIITAIQRLEEFLPVVSVRKSIGIQFPQIWKYENQMQITHQAITKQELIDSIVGEITKINGRNFEVSDMGLENIQFLKKRFGFGNDLCWASTRTNIRISHSENLFLINISSGFRFWFVGAIALTLMVAAPIFFGDLPIGFSAICLLLPLLVYCLNSVIAACKINKLCIRSVRNISDVIIK